LGKITGLLLIIFTFILQVNAQTLIEDEIVGTWSVVQIKVLTKLPDEQKKTFDMLKEAFLRSKFNFNQDHTFVFDFEIEKMKIPNGYWKYNELNKSFIIQDMKDKDSNDWKLMEIYTKKEDHKIIFQLRDIFVELLVKKEF